MNVKLDMLIIILLIMVGIMVLLPLFMQNNYEYENFTDTVALSNEALQNLASVYNADKLSVTNLLSTDGATITNNASIGKNLSVGGNSTLSGDLSLGGSSTISKNLNVTGKVAIGNDATISGNTLIGGNTSIGGTMTGNKLNVTDITGTSIVVPGYTLGAYIIGSNGYMPVISSVKDYKSITDDVGYTILPGYKLVAYQIAQNTNDPSKFSKGTNQNTNGKDKNAIPNANTLTCDNTNGTTPMFCSSNLQLPDYKPDGYKSYRTGQNFSGSGKSCQLFYKNTLLSAIPLNSCVVSGGTTSQTNVTGGVSGMCVA